MPISTPNIIAKEKPLKISPPKINIEKRARRVVTEVIIVRAKVSLIDKFAISLISYQDFLLSYHILQRYHSLNNQR